MAILKDLLYRIVTGSFCTSDVSIGSESLQNCQKRTQNNFLRVFICTYQLFFVTLHALSGIAPCCVPQKYY